MVLAIFLSTYYMPGAKLNLFLGGGGGAMQFAIS